MSIHTSLKTASTMKRHRSVLNRLERVKILQDRGVFDPEHSSLLGLPKVKHLKMRIRKEKAAAPAAEAAGGTAAAPGGATASAGAPGAGAKSGAAKPAGKAAGAASKPEAGVSPKKKE